MTSLRSWFVSLAIIAVLLLAGRPALAQTQAQPSGTSSMFDGRATVHFNVGVQAGSDDISQTFTPLIYDEPASISIEQAVENGALIDIGGSYMVYGDFGVGMSYSHTSGDGDATINGQIPHPIIADRFRNASTSATGLNHSENALHFALLYRFAATPKIDVTAGLGPSFFFVKQDLVPTVNVTEDAGNPVITPAIEEGSDTAVGVNVGADVTYMVTDRFGAGVLLRYAKSTAEVSAAESQSVDVDAGGFQFAVGVRVRF